MNRAELEEKIIKLVAIQISIDFFEISMDSNLTQDLGFDSLDLVEMVMNLENEFNINIKDEEAEMLITVQQLVDYIEKKISE